MSPVATARTRATQALQSSCIPALRRLKVEEIDGQVVISGSVNTYYLKQMAQEAIMPVVDRSLLANRVTVD